MHDDRLATLLWTVAGLGTWFVLGVLPVLDIARDPALLFEFRHLAWLAAYVGFGVVFGVGDRIIERRGIVRTERGLLVVQSLLAAVALAAVPEYGFMAILFIITASMAARVFELRAAAAWVAAQTVVISIVSLSTQADAAIGAVQSLAYLGFQVFALLTTHGARKEAAGRAALVRQAAELRATQQLLAESSRAAERVRISRELHDLLGHHLTALAVNLEVAGHLTDGKAKEHVKTSHGLAKLLLADLREVVSTMRDDASLDLAGALEALVRDIPRPAIHLRIADDLDLDDVARAHAIVRCVQEIVTNAMRHAAARNLWIDVERDAGNVVVRARDDGRGGARVQVGSGLAGMRERLEGLGGRLHVQAAPDRGFALEASIPVGAP